MSERSYSATWSQWQTSIAELAKQTLANVEQSFDRVLEISTKNQDSETQTSSNAVVEVEGRTQNQKIAVGKVSVVQENCPSEIGSTSEIDDADHNLNQNNVVKSVSLSLSEKSLSDSQKSYSDSECADDALKTRNQQQNEPASIADYDIHQYVRDLQDQLVAREEHISELMKSLEKKKADYKNTSRLHREVADQLSQAKYTYENEIDRLNEEIQYYQENLKSNDESLTSEQSAIAAYSEKDIEDQNTTDYQNLYEMLLVQCQQEKESWRESLELQIESARKMGVEDKTRAVQKCRKEYETAIHRYEEIQQHNVNEIDALKQEICNLKTTYEADSEEREQYIADMEDSLSKGQQGVNQLNEELAAVKQSNAIQIQKALEDNDTLRKENIQCRTELHRHHEELNTLRQKVIEMNQLCQNLKDENLSLKTKIEDIKRSTSEADSVAKEMKTRETLLVSQIEMLKEELVRERSQIQIYIDQQVMLVEAAYEGKLVLQTNSLNQGDAKVEF